MKGVGRMGFLGTIDALDIHLPLRRVGPPASVLGSCPSSPTTPNCDPAVPHYCRLPVRTERDDGFLTVEEHLVPPSTAEFSRFIEFRLPVFVTP
jgi:hypothetical protein